MEARASLAVDAVVVGAGVVGLAVARALAATRSVLVLERHAAIATEGSARNSGIVHAGIHDPPGSLKTTLCVRGRALLYAHCARAGVAHRRTGKLVVACDEDERATLEAIAARAVENDAGEIRMLDARRASALEPEIRCVAALHVAETGVVDVRALVSSIAAEARDRGARVELGREVIAIERARDGFAVRCSDRSIAARQVVIAAGLDADRVAALAGIDVGALGLRHRFAKGDWLAVDDRLRGRVSRPVYPIPDIAGLGVHLTVELDGRLRAGPDVEWIDAPRWDPTPGKERAFARAMSRWLPSIDAADLRPLASGVRPKLHGPGEPRADFAIHDAGGGLVALLGIESPGLTACLAIAEHVERMLAAP